MIIHLPPFWIAGLNVIACLVLQTGIAWGVTQIRANRFRPDAWLYRKREWERNGHLYEDLFHIRKWKTLLPDGAAWFKKGFAKKRLNERSAEYCRRFGKETCRGELAHWLQIACAPLFFLWNPAWAGWAVASFLLLANFPCLLAQRYNRIRLASSRMCRR